MTPRGERAEHASAGRREITVGWGIATFWNAVAFPLAGLALAKEGLTFWTGLMLVFPAIGIYLVANAIRTTQGFARRGEAWLTLEPPEPRLGEPFDARLRFEKPPPGEIDIVLVCRETERNVDSAAQRILWAQQRTTRVRGDRASASFIAPPGQPPSGQDTSAARDWGLLVRFPRPHVDERWFDVEMHA